MFVAGGINISLLESHNFSLCSGRWSCRVNTPGAISLHAKLRTAESFVPCSVFLLSDKQYSENCKVDVYILYPSYCHWLSK